MIIAGLYLFTVEPAFEGIGNEIMRGLEFILSYAKYLELL